MEMEVYEVWVYWKNETIALNPLKMWECSDLDYAKEACDKLYEEVYSLHENGPLRVEVIETQEKQIIYGRGYRPDVTVPRPVEVQ